jgi:hypothetical protein
MYLLPIPIQQKLAILNILCAYNHHMKKELKPQTLSADSNRMLHYAEEMKFSWLVWY